MKEVCKKKDCTGCGLCASLCPHKCIEMRSVDKIGHLYPIVDTSRCSDCGRCRRVCPSMQAVELHSPSTAYAAWARSGEEYKSSSSGGAASVLARHIIRCGGVVYGCAMLPGVEIKHLRIVSEEGLTLLKGSKYVQSDISHALAHIKDDVQSGRPVLFVGTPCQVSAVRNLFSSVPDNLFLVDLICHGVPSRELLKNHIDRIIPYQNCQSVVFREGNNYGLKVIQSVDGTPSVVYESSVSHAPYEDFYINAFMYAYTYRDSCYRCRYAQPNRPGDITIGDFWGLGDNVPADNLPEHDGGCSLIMPISEKGMKLVDEIKPMLHIYERTVPEAVDGNDQLRKPSRKGPRVKLYRALARHTAGSWPYYLAISDLRLRYKLKRRIKR